MDKYYTEYYPNNPRDYNATDEIKAKILKLDTLETGDELSGLNDKLNGLQTDKTVYNVV